MDIDYPNYSLPDSKKQKRKQVYYENEKIS